ncbi:oxoglutarate-dependent flavonoid 7-O-demethylase 1-like [Tasmannia lanceolata]|uniref:oxoglutarate-dependent flavonoid 7-O-demethylase 1-like n=1 Tax=Tasmannia lanceolata TaxID=3420 RepID=UPI0040634C4B
MESPTPVALAGSLPVPNVQELATQHMLTVPPRYVRSDQDPPIISDSNSLPMIPIIDMESLLHGESMALELERLHSTCKEWGFFQLVNHGVSSTLVEKMKYEIQAFFKLPLEEKNKLGQLPGDVEGYGQAFVVSEEQKLDWADMFFLINLPAYLRKPHLYEKLPFSLRETLEEYGGELQKLAVSILEQLARALGMDVVEMKELFEDGYQGIRMNYYPPCPQPELVMGFAAHSDSVGLTILLQVSETDGLQVRHQGTWIPVKPLPNAFIVNVGDILEMLSNGVYRSMEHRATANSVQERLSIAAFCNPKLNGEIGPAHSLINPQNPAIFKRIGVEEYFRGYLSRPINGKTYLDFMRIDDGEHLSI